MPFAKGNTLGQGRPKGSINKVNEKVRQAIDALLEGHMPDFTQVLGELRENNPVKYTDAILRLMEYSVPKQRAVESTVEFEGEGISKIVVELKQRESGSNPELHTDIPEELGE
jgi:hypothetical protein